MFERDGVLFRQINGSYERHFAQLIQSGLYDELTEAKLLVPHAEVGVEIAPLPGAFKVIQPERVPLVSYPYEWSFSQLKDAALLTLEVHRRALSKGMVLKDASAYNVQFVRGRPILIDTLSFETYEDGHPWIAYGQFARHFIAPLALMSLVDVRLNSLLRAYIDGIPLDFAAGLLPTTAMLRPGLLMHLRMHAKASTRPAGESTRSATVSRTGMLALAESLYSTIESLRWKPAGTEWADYYSDNNYSKQAMQSKHDVVASMIEAVDERPKTCWDLGANNAEFSRIASDLGIETIAWDVDPAAVEQAYLSVQQRGDQHLLPLLQDLANPSPGQGWASTERESLSERGPADLVLALALVHHLAIGNNVPLDNLARYLGTLGKWAIVEFVPKEDTQVRRMLASREDIFSAYNEEGFESAFSNCFEVVKKQPIPETQRSLYLLRRRQQKGLAL